jgi:DinB family protein
MMDAKQAQHLDRVRHLRESFVEANERLVARLRRVDDEAAERVPEKGWSPAQIGWHVATVTTRFAGVISGDLAGAQPLPADFTLRPWDEIAAAIPTRLQAPAGFEPPRTVRRADAISALEAAGMRMARAFDALTETRGAGLGITSPVVGTINLYQVAEWATAHVIRHNKQAKQTLGEL